MSLHAALKGNYTASAQYEAGVGGGPTWLLLVMVWPGPPELLLVMSSIRLPPPPLLSATEPGCKHYTHNTSGSQPLLLVCFREVQLQRLAVRHLIFSCCRAASRLDRRAGCVMAHQNMQPQTSVWLAKHETHCCCCCWRCCLHCCLQSARTYIKSSTTHVILCR